MPKSMNIKIALLGLVFLTFISCCKNTDEPPVDNILVTKKESAGKYQETDFGLIRDRRTLPKVECIFEQSAQNDDFIKNIPEIEFYEWDKKTHTATVSLENGNTLDLFRGGCDHFSIGGTLRMFGLNKLEEEVWIEKVVWIATLLQDEMKPDSLNEAILNGGYFVHRYSPTFQALKFKSKFLRDMNYSVDLVEKGEYSQISVYMTMN